MKFDLELRYEFGKEIITIAGSSCGEILINNPDLEPLLLIQLLQFMNKLYDHGYLI